MLFRSGSGLSRKEQKRLEAEMRQSRSKGRKEQQQRVARLEKEVTELESRLAELTTELEKPETYAKAGAAMHLNRELSGVQHALDQRTAEWETASSKLAEIEAQESGES